MCGIGVIVMVLEFDSFLGLPAPHSVMEALRDIPLAVLNANPQALMVSVPTLAILFLWPVFGRKSRLIASIPAPLVALLMGTEIANFWNFDIEYIGDIPAGLPEIYFPDLNRFGELLVPAASLAGLAIFDSLLTCIVADHMIGKKHSSDRETFGQGLANMAAGLVGGLTTATATMRTVTNIKSGGKTPLAAIIHGVVLAALALGLGFLAERIPMAVLAAILFKVGIEILDYRVLPVLHRLPWTDMIVFWVVLVVTVVEDLLIAMGVGVVLAFFRFVQEMSRMYKHQVVFLDKVRDDLIAEEIKNKIKVLKPQGPLFFGSIEPLETTYKNAEEHDVLVIDLSGVTMVDLSGAYALEDLILKAKDNGKEIFVCNAMPEVEDLLRRIKVVEHIGERSFFHVEEEAVVQAQELELAKLTHNQILKQTGIVLSAKDHREQLTGAASFAHDVVSDPGKRKYYDDNNEFKKAFTTAVEDYMIGPEIHDFDPNGYNGQKGHILSWIITDNYKVDEVKVVITNVENDFMIESGNAFPDSNDARKWNFKTALNASSPSGFRIHVEARDLPGNSSSKDYALR